jgi:hypothetical protein
VFERTINCFEIPNDGRVYQNLIIYNAADDNCNGSIGDGAMIVSRVELIQDRFTEASDFTLTCPKEVELGKEAECTMTDVYCKWEKENSPGVWEVLIDSQLTPVFPYFVMQTTKFRLTREFRQPNGQPVGICQGLATTDVFTVTVEGHLPDAEFSTSNITACNFSVDFFSNDVGAGVTHEWNISPSNQLPPSTDANPTLTFPGPGTYLVSHTVTTNCGSRVFSKEIVLECDPPPGCSCPTNSYYIGVPNAASTLHNYLQSNGGPLPDNPTGPINVIIDGVLNVTTTYTFPEGSNICMGPGSWLIVTGNLSLVGTHVSGCNSMWRGIFKANGGVVTIKAGNSARSIIEDAEVGVRAFSGGAAELLTVMGTDFNKCAIGMLLYNTVFQGAPIADCTFNGSGPFKPTFQGQMIVPNGKSQYGIFLDEVSTFTAVGSNAMGANTFIGMGTGIYAKNSNLNLLNSQFSNIKDTNTYGAPEGHAVYCEGLGRTFRQGANGCSTLPTNVTISNCTKGMYFGQMHVSARQNTISGVNEGIILKQCKARGIFICGNTINAKVYGIKLIGNDNAMSILVQDNAITVDHQNTQNPLNAAAILVTEGDGTKQLNAVIQDNIDIYSNVLDGIKLDGCNGYKLINNVVNRTSTSSNGIGYGINILNSDNLLVKCNDVLRNNSTGLDNDEVGMSVMATRTATYSCNTISGSGTGLVFDMDCSSSRNIATNTTGYYTGLIYAPTAITGKQPNPVTGKRHGNKWGNIPTGVGAMGAVHGSGSLGFRRESEYTVQINSSGFYPPPTNLNLDWFTVDATNSDYFNCSPSSNVCPIFDEEPYPDGDFELLKKVAKGELSPGVYDEQTKWIMEYGLYQKLYDKPSLMTGEPILSAFYSAKSSTPMGYLSPIWAGIRNLFQLDNATAAQVAALEQTIEARLTEIAGIDEQLPTAIGTPSYAPLLAQRALASDALNTANSSYQSLMNSINTARNAQADNLLASNEAITTTKVYEQNEKTVNRVYLATIGKGVYSPNATQQTELAAVANQCPYTGGKAVLRARGLLTMLGVEAYYDDAANCQPVQQFGGNQAPAAISGQQMVAKVFPNPTKERFNLMLDTPLESDAELVLTNAFGQTVAVYSLDAGLLSYEFGTSNLTEGIYFLSVKEGKNLLFSTRLIVQK